MLTRTPHWATKDLHNYLLSRASMPFSYKGNDCCTFSCSAIASFTGVDMAADFGNYTTANGALKAIKKVTGGTGVEAAVVWCSAKYELKEWPSPMLAQRGDLVLTKDDDLMLAIVALNGRELLAPGDKGIKCLPFSGALRAWRIG